MEINWTQAAIAAVLVVVLVVMWVAAYRKQVNPRVKREMVRQALIIGGSLVIMVAAIFFFFGREV